MDQENKLSEIRKIEGALEAILFAAGHPVSYEKIGEALELTPGDAKRIAEHLAEKYNSNTDGGIMMLLFPDTCQLCSREDYIPYVRIALGIRRGGNLSNSALEVLAIVAYNQPVTRSFIDTARGVDSAYAVGSLIDKELIEPCGKLDAPGRPTLLATTEKFLRVFGLNDLGDLPEGGALRGAADALLEAEEENEQLSIEDEEVTEESAENEEAEELYTPDDN
jgi:segregation and condensation protein B